MSQPKKNKIAQDIDCAPEEQTVEAQVVAADAKEAEEFKLEYELTDEEKAKLRPLTRRERKDLVSAKREIAEEIDYVVEKIFGEAAEEWDDPKGREVYNRIISLTFSTPATIKNF